MISREVALDWAEYVGIEARALADAEVIDQLEALINRAYAEGQNDMRDAAQEKYDDLRIETMGTDLFIKDLQSQVKLLRECVKDYHQFRPTDLSREALAATELKGD